MYWVLAILVLLVFHLWGLNVGVCSNYALGYESEGRFPLDGHDWVPLVGMFMWRDDGLIAGTGNEKNTPEILMVMAEADEQTGLMEGQNKIYSFEYIFSTRLIRVSRSGS